MQNKVLMAEFQKDPHWSRGKIQQLHERLGLKQSQIYKWNWDMLRKTSSDQMKNGNEVNPYENDGSESGSNLSDNDDSKSDCNSETGSEAMEA